MPETPDRPTGVSPSVLTRARPSRIARWGTRAASLAATLMTGAIAIAMVAGGVLVLQDRASAVQIEEIAPPVRVATMRIEPAAGYVVTRAFVGQIEARQATSLAFEIGGRVKTVLVDEGDRVRAGDAIARLETAALANQRATTVAARAALEAQGELARLTTERQVSLVERGHATRSGLDQARLGLAEIRARIAEIDSRIAGIDIQLDKADLTAPFDGIVGARFIDTGATVADGQPVLEVLQEGGGSRIRVGLPEDVAATLQSGARATFETAGGAWPVTFDRLRADVDPATRTRVALFSFDTAGPRLFGSTGTLSMPQQVDEAGAWVPLAALREGVRGLWTVLSVNDEGRVVTEAVELLHADETRAFVRGTFPPGTAIVRSGQHRVTPGQIVVASEQ